MIHDPHRDLIAVEQVFRLPGTPDECITALGRAVTSLRTCLRGAVDSHLLVQIADQALAVAKAVEVWGADPRNAVEGEQADYLQERVRGLLDCIGDLLVRMGMRPKYLEWAEYRLKLDTLAKFAGCASYEGAPRFLRASWPGADETSAQEADERESRELEQFVVANWRQAVVDLVSIASGKPQPSTRPDMELVRRAREFARLRGLLEQKYLGQSGSA
jgi:hypothetical protein